MDSPLKKTPANSIIDAKNIPNTGNQNYIMILICWYFLKFCKGEIRKNITEELWKKFHTRKDGLCGSMTRSVSQEWHLRPSIIKQPLINITLPEIPQAVLDGIGNFQTGQVEAVTVRVRIHEHRAHLVPVVKIIERLYCKTIHNNTPIGAVTGKLRIYIYAFMYIRRVKQGLKI